MKEYCVLGEGVGGVPRRFAPNPLPPLDVAHSLFPTPPLVVSPPKIVKVY